MISKNKIVVVAIIGLALLLAINSFAQINIVIEKNVLPGIEGITKTIALPVESQPVFVDGKLSKTFPIQMSNLKRALNFGSKKPIFDLESKKIVLTIETAENTAISGSFFPRLVYYSPNGDSLRAKLSNYASGIDCSKQNQCVLEFSDLPDGTFIGFLPQKQSQTLTPTDKQQIIYFNQIDIIGLKKIGQETNFEFTDKFRKKLLQINISRIEQNTENDYLIVEYDKESLGYKISTTNPNIQLSEPANMSAFFKDFLSQENFAQLVQNIQTNQQIQNYSINEQEQTITIQTTTINGLTIGLHGETQ